MKSKFFLSVLFAAVSVSSIQSFAGEGTNSGGGGNAVGAKLLDFYENDQTEKIVFEETEEFKQVIKPIFSSLDKTIPGLTAWLMEGAHARTWLLDAKSIDGVGQCINSSIVRVTKTVVGCQNGFEVRLKKQWMKSSRVSLTQKAGLMVHELARFKVQQRKFSQVSDVALHAFVRAIFDASLSPSELQRTIKQAGFGLWLTAMDFTVAKVDVAREVLPLCENPKTKPYEIFEKTYGLSYRYVSSSPAVSVALKALGNRIETYSGFKAMGNTSESDTPIVCEALKTVLKLPNN